VSANTATLFGKSILCERKYTDSRNYNMYSRAAHLCKGTDMFVQCCVCKRIRTDGKYRLPWPGELSGEIAETYCPRCARETLRLIQTGELAAIADRRAARRA
jgi:hypothetical protein